MLIKLALVLPQENDEMKLDKIQVLEAKTNHPTQDKSKVGLKLCAGGCFICSFMLSHTKSTHF